MYKKLNNTENYKFGFGNSKLSLTGFLIFFGFIIAVLTLAACTNNQGNKNIIANTNGTQEIYTCPMHPQIQENHPGKCPICGMDLVKKENAKREKSTIDLTTLLQPTNESVVSSIPVTVLQHSSQQKEMEALGDIEYDTRLIKTISARVSGRIEKLYVKYRYQHVHAGEKLMDIYSPELLTGQQNLLFLLKNDPTNVPLVNAAKQRLLLLGMTESQLQQIFASRRAMFTISVFSNYTGHIHEAGGMNNDLQKPDMSDITQELTLKEGMYVTTGQPVFDIYNMNKSWVALDIFPDDITFIKKGTPVTVIPESAPDKKYKTEISFIEPFFRPGNKTITARIYFNNSVLDLPIGSQVKGIITVNTKLYNWLPQQAVLSLGLKKVVLLKDGSAFKVHEVATGITANNLIQITGGISDKDSVAANAQFLIDSESFLKTP
jgi:Cu(I)/Ag(I) efflux system membrane fusion protein